MAADVPPRPSVTRRGALVGIAAAAGGVASGCRVRHGAAHPRPTEAGRAALLAALAEEDRLIALYDAAPVDGAVGEIRRDHVAHRAAIVAALGVAEAAPSTTRPLERRPTLGELRAAERTAEAARAADAIAAPASVASLLASIAASEASHGVLLRPRTGRR